MKRQSVAQTFWQDEHRRNQIEVTRKVPVVMGKRDADRDGNGEPQPDKWETWANKDDGNKHEGGDKDKK